MKLNIDITRVRGAVLDITNPELTKLLKLGHLEINEDKTELTLKCPIKIKVTTPEDDLGTWTEMKWMPLFPTQSISGGSANFASYIVSGNYIDNITRMREFCEKYEFTRETMLIATANYLDSKKRFNWRGTMKNHNFIRKELQVWCTKVLDNPVESLQIAKSYIEDVQRTAKRLRGKRISRLSIEREFNGFLDGIDGGESVFDGGGDGTGSEVSPAGNGGELSGGCEHIQPRRIKPIGDWGINKSRK